MRAAPAFQLSLQRFALWRVTVLALAALALAVILAWWGAQPGPRGTGVWVLALTGATAALLPALWVLRQRPVELRWDGRAWQLGAPTAAALTGELNVVLDLGAWMLLRFKSSASSAIVWLPVQRRGLEGQWHALRCAVYAARPAAAHDSALGGR